MAKYMCRDDSNKEAGVKEVYIPARPKEAKPEQDAKPDGRQPSKGGKSGNSWKGGKT